MQKIDLGEVTNILWPLKTFILNENAVQVFLISSIHTHTQNTDMCREERSVHRLIHFFLNTTQQDSFEVGFTLDNSGVGILL